MARILLAVLAVLLVLGGAGVFFVHTGRLPVAATTPADLVDRVAMTAKFEAVRRGGNGLQVMLPTDAAAIARGREHYVENCLPCHGGPGVKPAEFAQGMNPGPPDIDGALQNYTDAQLFWVIKNGLRATGMPAFGVNHKDEEIAAIAAFVRRTPHLTAEERKELAAAAPHEDHHHESEAQAVRRSRTTTTERVTPPSSSGRPVGRGPSPSRLLTEPAPRPRRLADGR